MEEQSVAAVRQALVAWLGLFSASAWVMCVLNVREGLNGGISLPEARSVATFFAFAGTAGILMMLAASAG
jgi:hypothetical protein